MTISHKHIDSHNKWKQTLVSCAKTTEAIGTTNSEGGLFCGCSLNMATGKPYSLLLCC
jgi:hypothetical protein